MKIVYKKVSELVPYENNPRKNDDAVQYVANSIKEFGFRNPIIIGKDNVIAAGHTRLKAAISLGMTEVPCIMADDLTEEQLNAFRIADNKTGEKASWDNGKLKLEIQDVLDGFDMTEFGFGEFELTMLVEDFEPEPYDDELIEKYSENENRHIFKNRVIIVYKDEETEKLKELLGVEEINKVVYDIGELA